MHSIRIKNLRSLKDTEKMVIKPINILVGGNSSGKSTFLRLFPLMKQSFSKRINGPILWAGDEEDYVDFGSFKEALCTNSDSKNIVFEFSIEKGDGMCWLPFGNYIDFGNASIEIALEKYDENDFDYVSMVKMLVWGNEVILKISQEKSIDSVVINNSIYQVTLVELEEVPFFFGEKVAFDVPMMGLMETARRKLQELLGIESEDLVQW